MRIIGLNMLRCSFRTIQPHMGINWMYWENKLGIGVLLMVCMWLQWCEHGYTSHYKHPWFSSTRWLLHIDLCNDNYKRYYTSNTRSCYSSALPLTYGECGCISCYLKVIIFDGTFSVSAIFNLFFAAADKKTFTDWCHSMYVCLVHLTWFSPTVDAVDINVNHRAGLLPDYCISEAMLQEFKSQFLFYSSHVLLSSCARCCSSHPFRYNINAAVLTGA